MKIVKRSFVFKLLKLATEIAILYRLKLVNMIIRFLKVLLKILIHFAIPEHDKFLNLWSVFNLLEVRDQKIQYFG